MYTHLSFLEASQLLFEDQAFSWAGCQALVDYLSNLEDSIGEPMHFNPASIRSNYCEYSSALEAANDYGFDEEFDPDLSPEDIDCAAIEWLQENTQVIFFNGGIIVENF